VQGLGWLTTEELVWSKNQRGIPDGTLLTRGPGMYKIPTANDIPIQFNVSLLKDSNNDRAIHSSKGVGEPPFFLAASAFFAIRNAIASTRGGDFFQLDAPATCERIRLLCEDVHVKLFTPLTPNPVKSAL